MERNYEVYKSLLRTSLILNTRTDLNKLLDQIVAEALTVIGAEAASLWLCSNNSLEITPSSIHGPATASFSLLRMKAQIGEGIIGQVILTGEPELVPNVHKDRRWAERFDESTGFVTKSILCLPLKVEAKILGALELLNKKDGTPFSQEDRELGMAYANLAALAYENNRLYLRQQYWLTDILDALVTAIELKDPESSGHSTRVAGYAAALGQALDLTELQRTHLQWGAYLHDIGKLGLKENDPEGYPRHPEWGARIISKIDRDNDLEDLYLIVACHHQYADGSGFPKDESGIPTPLLAQIVGLANDFDHLVTKDQLSLKAAAQSLAKNGKYQANLTNLLLQLATEWESQDDPLNQRLQKWF